MQTAHCINCGSVLTATDRFCIHCGANVSGYQVNPKRKSGLGKVFKWTGIGCGGLVGLFIILVILVAVFGGEESNPTASPSPKATYPPVRVAGPPHTQTIAPTPTKTFEEWKEESLSISNRVSYDDLFRDNESYIGDTVYFRAKIIQVIEGRGNRYQFRANVTQGDYFWEDTVLLHYSGTRLLEDDIIEFRGRVEGLVTYEAIFGNKITIPEIRIVESRLVAKASEPTPTPLPNPTSTPLPSAPGTPISTPDPIDLSGTGQQASSKFDLREGLAIFRMTHNGQSNFIIRLLDSGGNRISSLVNEIGTFDGSKAVRIEESGRYILDIHADGDWTVSVEQ